MSKNPSPEPKEGNHPSCTANTAMSTIEPTNEGIAAERREPDEGDAVQRPSSVQRRDDTS